MDDPETLKLRPVAGGRVRKPNGLPLDEAGETVVLDSYWRRRLAQGDVEIVPVETPATPSKKGAQA